MATNTGREPYGMGGAKLMRGTVRKVLGWLSIGYGTLF